MINRNGGKQLRIGNKSGLIQYRANTTFGKPSGIACGCILIGNITAISIIGAHAEQIPLQ